MSMWPELERRFMSVQNESRRLRDSAATQQRKVWPIPHNLLVLADEVIE
jgi:hypothetical protein